MIYAGSYAIPRLVSATIKATTSSMRAFSLSGLLPAVRVDPPHRLTRGLFHNGQHASGPPSAALGEPPVSVPRPWPVHNRYDYMRTKRGAIVMRAIHYEGDF